MEDNFSVLVASAGLIESSEGFESWVRHRLRKEFPHAALLVTIGKLYGAGSVPTHRFSIDYPLSMVEELKNSAGAIDDPMMYGWFRSGKLRYVNMRDVEEFGGQRRWREVLIKYGMRSMLIHGVMDHTKRRFVVFQVGNPYYGGSLNSINLISSLVEVMARAVWRAIDNRVSDSKRTFFGHPTLSLTPTEVHIIQCLAQGLSNKEIARLRGVSDSTIKTQVQRTGSKIGATRRAEIVAIAMPMLSPLPAQRLIDYDDL